MVKVTFELFVLTIMSNHRNSCSIGHPNRYIEYGENKTDFVDFMFQPIFVPIRLMNQQISIRKDVFISSITKVVLH
jgi:hypothetical protein